MKSLSELIELMSLKKINNHTFIGNNYSAPWGRVFGGQVLAQSLYAAYQTVPRPICTFYACLFYFGWRSQYPYKIRS